MRLYDIGPLVRIIGIAADEVDEEAQEIRTATAFGIDVRTLRSWVEDGGVDCWTADKVALRCGLHPALVWSNWNTPDPDEIRDDEQTALPGVVATPLSDVVYEAATDLAALLDEHDALAAAAKGGQGTLFIGEREKDG